MAERRMFAKTIIDSDAFLDLPLSTQALYFHLSMRADDDGFINNPKKIMRMVGSNDDEMTLLKVKKFIMTFESGVIVIKHWKIHNLIQKDRYKPTHYIDEFNLLEEKENKSYKIDDQICIQDGNTGKSSLGESSLVKVNNMVDDLFETWWIKYDKKVKKKPAYKKWLKLNEFEKGECIRVVDDYVKSTPDKSYRKDPTTYINQESWNDEIISNNKETTKGYQGAKYTPTNYDDELAF
jgi:hypothetical protein